MNMPKQKTIGPDEQLSEAELLEKKKDAAWDEYTELSIPAAAALERYRTAKTAHEWAVVYAIAKRQVMKELIDAAGRPTGKH